jgi:ATP-dependent protease ClpP protease subunit
MGTRVNKRRREILAALEPALEFAHRDSPNPALRPVGQVPGLALHARVSAEAPAELLIYGPITNGGIWGEGISASDVAAVLREAGAGPVNVRINSPGGDVFQGVAIHSLLARHPGTVTTYVDGLAASAASFIMLAGDRIVVARNAMVMIHDGMTGAYGNSATLKRSAELLEKVSENIADMYAERAGEDAPHWRNLMTVNGEDGTWYTGTEAFASGLVDEVTEPGDDGPEGDLVWDRMRAWTDRMPAAVLAELPRLAVEDDVEDPDEDEPDADDVVIPEAPDADDTESGTDKDFAHAMSMWAFLNKSGHTARNGVSQ